MLVNTSALFLFARSVHRISPQQFANVPFVRQRAAICIACSVSRTPRQQNIRISSWIKSWPVSYSQGCIKLLCDREQGWKAGLIKFSILVPLFQPISRDWIKSRLLLRVRTIPSMRRPSSWLGPFDPICYLQTIKLFVSVWNGCCFLDQARLLH